MKTKDYLKLISVFLLALIAYIPVFVWMWERWFAKESYYGHGILIPIVSLYVLWQRRERLKNIIPRRHPAGIILIGIGLFIHIICALLRIYFMSAFSFIIVFYGIVLFFLGKETARQLTFPIFFLSAMIPLPLVLIGNLTVRLKLFAAQAAAFILNRIGFPCVRDGSLIRMPASYISVGAPCSGLRSLISLLTLGVIFAQSINTSLSKKAVLFLSSVPIAITANVARIILLAIVNDLYGQKAALGFFHDFSGFLVFVFAFLGLFYAGKILER
ncbi:MAG: exosortase/archaeosortase family protein [Candidatus Omnitrophota bacterium]